MAQTTKQLAKKLGVSQRTVQRRIKARKIKASKPGHDYIISGSGGGSKRKTKRKSKGKRKGKR
jgi:excisionase family DNA binding protein